MKIVLDDQPKALPQPPNTETVRRKKHRQMDRLRRTLSFRSKKKGNTSSDTRNNSNNNNNNTENSTKTANNVPETTNSATTENKPPQWQDDEKSVRGGTCTFNVKVTGNSVLVEYLYKF